MFVEIQVMVMPIYIASAQQGSNTDSHKSNGVNGGTYYGPKTNAPTNYWMIEFNNSYSLSDVQSAVF